MIVTRKVFHLVLITFFFVLNSGLLFAETPLQFSWAVLTDTPEGQKALDFTEPTILSHGATLQIYLEQKPGAYIYIYLIDSTGSLEFLFPGERNFYSSITPTDRIVMIPAKPNRFELTPPGGQEKLHLMASSSRLAGLEKLTAEYLKQPEDPRRQAAVIQEIKHLKRQHSKLAQTTETSVQVAGTVRSRGALFDSFEVTKVNAQGFYSRILRINHE